MTTTLQASPLGTAQKWSGAFRPLLLMWKVRLPLIALPVLAGLRRLGGAEGHIMSSPVGSPPWIGEFTLLITIALGTGFFQLPFSVTWWLVLMVAFALETQLLLSVATVLSLTVLLSWYGSLFRHPHMICAIWCCRLTKATESSTGIEVNFPLSFWQAWDLMVHGTPAVLMLLWHGPSLSSSGIVTTAAVLTALPLNILWLWGVVFGLGRPPWKARLVDTNAVYQISPGLPERCWQWIYGSHTAACTLWLVLLVFPTGVARYGASIPILWAWQLLARSHFREDLLVGRATFYLVAHVLAVCGAYRTCVHTDAWRLWLEVVLMWQMGGLGITCGAHRLWSHRSFVAELPFRVVLMLLTSFANQGTIYHWARDHRAHHKFTDTDADPHNTTRGFFYAHIGWLLLPKTAELKRKGEAIPHADLLADPVVAFQKRAEEKFMWMELVSFGLPTLYGYLVYSDALLGFLVHGILRWIITLHATWCVNSFAHFFGDRQYDPSASARQSFLTSLLSVGEGWHSYHHKYAWDYATSEFGVFRQWNPSKLVIDLAYSIGQAKHLKRADGMARKAQKTCSEMN